MDPTLIPLTIVILLAIYAAGFAVSNHMNMTACVYYKHPPKYKTWFLSWAGVVYWSLILIEEWVNSIANRK